MPKKEASKQANKLQKHSTKAKKKHSQHSKTVTQKAAVVYNQHLAQHCRRVGSRLNGGILPSPVVSKASHKRRTS